MTIIAAVLIGIVHGLTELLPLSSSGHMSVIGSMFGINLSTDGHLIFDFLLHLGTLASVCIIFWQDLCEMAFQGLSIFNLGPYAGRRDLRLSSARELLMLLAATLPLIYVIFVRKYLEVLYLNTYLVGTMLLLNGLIILCGDRISKGRKTGGSISVIDAVIIGICQTVGAIPGISRTAVTLSAGYVMGLRRDYAIRFSFLLYIPACLGYLLLDLVEAIKAGIIWKYFPAYLLGTVTSILAGTGALFLLKRIVSKDRLGGLSYYCFVAGVISIILTMIF